jgi:hypothetical protein
MSRIRPFMLFDRGYVYNWTVRANDGEGMGLGLLVM